MRICDILNMDIPAKDIIKITGLDTTKRTVNKARRDLGDSRTRLGYEDTIKLTQEQLIELEKAVAKFQQTVDKQHAESMFQTTIKKYYKHVSTERALRAVYQSLFSNFVKKKTPDSDLFNACIGAYKDYYNAMQETIATRKALCGNRQLPAKLIAIDKKLAHTRKETTNVESYNFETFNKTVQNSDS